MTLTSPPLSPLTPKKRRPQRVPRSQRWWIGAAVLTISGLLLAFVVDVSLFSRLQHERAQELGYENLRVAMAKSVAPVGQLDFDKKLVANGTPVAFLQIPAIGLNEVVFQGTTSDVTRRGPGHRRDSVMPGQSGTSVLMGRQTTYGSPFADLKRLQPGDKITVVTGQGTFRYTVFGLRRAGDKEPATPSAGEGRLELNTADGLSLFPDGVLYVDADLDTKAVDTPSSVMSLPALPSDELAMGQDTSSLFAAFFVLVFLVAALAASVWAWFNWGRRQAWLIGAPVVIVLVATCADLVMNAVPNLV